MKYYLTDLHKALERATASGLFSTCLRSKIEDSCILQNAVLQKYIASHYITYRTDGL
jgi:hypothetical protein